ncbi:MAG: hypothetical protein ACK56T_17820 [Dolichospermum sp.]
MSKPESITFFTDRCLGAGTVPEKLRHAGIQVEIHDQHFGQGTQDVDWLPEIGQRGWVVLTKDERISRNKLERIAVARAQIKMFILTSQGLKGEEMAEIFIKATEQMQRFVRKHPAPFIAKISRDGKITSWKDSQMLLAEMQQSDINNI